LPVERLGHTPGRHQAGAAPLLPLRPFGRQQVFGLLRQPAEHAHTVHKQATVGWVVDVGLYAGGVQAQFPPLRDPGLPGQLGGALDEPMQGLGLQGMGSADQGRVVGGLLPGQPAEPAQHQALVDLVLGLLELPSVCAAILPRFPSHPSLETSGSLGFQQWFVVHRKRVLDMQLDMA
jgi:hypothetical protein